MKTIKIKTLKLIGILLFIVTIVGMSLIVINVLDIKLSTPAKVYYEPDTETAD